MKLTALIDEFDQAHLKSIAEVEPVAGGELQPNIFQLAADELRDQTDQEASEKGWALAVEARRAASRIKWRNRQLGLS